jgi:UDP-N-acetylmuramoyl-L-alanyl-D-glutamate--2,6-diaminopimelate ligase
VTAARPARVRFLLPFPGELADGASFAKAAVANGAVAVVASHDADLNLGDDAVILRTDNPRLALSLMAARLYAPQPDIVVAVTGTNGKTSVASFVRQIWSILGLPAASVGTVGIVSPSGTRKLAHTTPDPVEIHGALQALSGEHVSHVALEASSHGLAQYRLHGVRTSLPPGSPTLPAITWTITRPSKPTSMPR